MEQPPAEAAPPIPVAGAVPQSERIVAIDVLRGFALLGILLMNIQSFSMIGAAYVNPKAYGDLTGANYAVWLFCHIFADQKFMSIFSMLFGVGILLMTGRQEQKTGASMAVHFRRMGVLLIFGLMHAYLIWFGDILVAYALCGMVAYFFRRLPPWLLLILGLCAISVHTLINVGVDHLLQQSTQSLVEFRRDMQPPAEDVARELTIHRGGWLGQMRNRAGTALFFQTIIFCLWTAWRSGGLMLIGMALFKLGVFEARRPASWYWAMLIVGMAIGLPIIVYGHHLIVKHQWDPVYAMFAGSEFNYWGSALVALAYVGGIMLLCRHEAMGWLTRPLAAVGQMAFTNYLMQSIICTLIFYGHGLGYFGYVERVGQLGIVLAVWAIQLIISPIWLRYFQFGPAEWLWRALTYGTLPRMRRGTQ